MTQITSPSVSTLYLQSPQSSQQFMPQLYITTSQTSKARTLSPLSHNDTSNNDFDERSQLSMIHETMSSNSKTIDNSMLKKRRTDNQGEFKKNQFTDTYISNTDQVSRNSDVLSDTHKNPFKANSRVFSKLRDHKRGSSQISTTIQMLNDREKFTIAKNSSNINILLELIASNDAVGRSNSAYELNTSNQYYNHKKHNSRNFNEAYNENPYARHQKNNSSQQWMQSGQGMTQRSHTNSQITNGTPMAGQHTSDLNKQWMDCEQLVSHCAINQLTYIMLQKRKELKLHMFYNLLDQKEKRKEFISARMQVLKHFDDYKTIEKRMQKYILMADDVGMQSSLYLLLVLSDDEINGIQSLDKSLEQRNSMSSTSNVSENQKNQFSSSPKNREKKIPDKDLQSGWFKKFINQILNNINNVLCDQSFSISTIRLTILLLNNLYRLYKTLTKSFAKKKSTYQKYLSFFERERENMNDEELIELEKALSKFYSAREIFILTRRQKQISRVKDVYQQMSKNQLYDEQPRPSRLIRVDSSESLIEMIRSEKHLQSVSNNNQLNLSSGEACNSTQNMNSYEFKMLGTEPNKFIFEHEKPRDQTQLELRQHIRKTGSVGPDSQNLFQKGRNSKNMLQRDAINMNGSQEFQSKNKKIDISSTIVEQAPKGKSRYNIGVNNQKYPSIYSKRSRRNVNTESQEPSKMNNETPIDQTFLDMKESFFLKDRSFYQKIINDQSREESKYQGSFVFTRSPKNSHFQKSTIIVGQGQEYHNERRDKKKEAKYNRNGGVIDYIDLDLKAGLMNSQESTQMGTRLITSNYKNDFNQNKNTKLDYASQTSCCVFFSNKKSKRSTIHKNTLMSTQQDLHKSYQSRQNSEKPSSLIIKEEEKSQTGSSINHTFYKCAHNKKRGEICRKCEENFEVSKKETQEKLSNCNIF